MHETVLEGPLDPRQLRQALGRFATGVTVITTCTATGKREGLTANSFASLSLDPPLVLWSLGARASSLASFVASGHFALSVLHSDQRDVAQHFATPQADKFVGISVDPGLGGCPLIPAALATFECRTDRTIEAGDHLLFIGTVQRARYRDGDPLAFYAGRYCHARPMPGAKAPSELDLNWSGLG